MRSLAFVLVFVSLAARAAPLSQGDAAKIGRAGDIAGLRLLIAERNQGLLFTAANSWPLRGARQLPGPLEALIVEHYRDPVAQRPLLAFLARELERYERFPRYRSRALFDLLYADLKSGRESHFYSGRIVATDLPVEPEFVALLPQLNAESANELVMFLGARKYAAAVPALKALQARIPRERDINGLLDHVDWALLQIGTPEALQAVLARLRTVAQDKDPRAAHELWAILLHAKDLPPGSPPDYAELRAALPSQLSDSSWETLIELIAKRKEKHGAPELVRAIAESPKAPEAVEALLAIGEPADLRAGRAALERAKHLPPERVALLQKRLDDALADPAKLAVQREQTEAAQTRDAASRQFGQEKSRIAALRTSDAKRYAAEQRGLLARYAQRLPAATLEREYMELGALLRFRLGQPDEAIAAFEAARRLRSGDNVDFSALAIADTERFDKRNARRAAASYRTALQSVEKIGPKVQNAELVVPLKQWLAHELAYVEQGRRFSGTIGRNDMAAAQLWLLMGSLQEPLVPPIDERTLRALPASQYQIARVFPALLEFAPAEMLAFFAKHDPAGYLTAGMLGAATYRGQGSPFVKAAAQTFFRERGIRGPSAAADARYASPEKTWTAFLGAAKAGNAAAMLACLTSEMQRKLEPLLRQMSRDELRAMAESFTGFALQGGDGQFREALVVRQQKERRMGGMITFFNDGGGWKIAEM